MWLEKLCKAYLWQAALTKVDLPSFKGLHNVVGRVLPGLVREHWARVGYVSAPDFHEIRELCKEFDRLHPQVDDGGRRPDNVEYPWSEFRDGRSRVVAPADERFKLAERLYSHSGKQLMKAATWLTRKPSIWSPRESS